MLPAELRTRLSGTYIPEFDGLRGIAVLLVVLYHFSFWLEEGPAPLKALHMLLTPGWTGVDLFFILSGCLITGILIDQKGTAGYFRRFYIRRARRIAPVYYLALLVCFTVASPWILPPTGVPRVTVAAYVLNLSNWLSLRQLEIFGINPYWSLAVEEQFYLCWPLAVFFLSRKALVRLIAGLIVLAPLVRFGILATVADPESARRMALVLTPARVDGLAFGALVAILLREPRLRDLVVRNSTAALSAIVGVLVVWFGLKSRFHLETAGPLSMLYTLLSMAYGLIVLRSAVRTGENGLVERILRSRILKKAGRYSYAAYVFHFALMTAVWPAFDRLPPHTRAQAALPAFLCGVGITFVLARLSWSLIEAPILSKAKGRPSPSFAPTPSIAG
jgi:peptidoglycan/LPS O-acetylase OafA/YrhL